MANLRASSRLRRVAARRVGDEDPAAVEDLHLRNYAHRTHEPALVVTTPDGEVVTRRTSRVPPGRCRSERDLVAPGTYVVRVRLDGRDDDRVACRIGGDPGATAPVELGSGVVTVSPGCP